ncbi:MAG: heat-shock protein HslJ, partial [Gemmatimonadetes bacterium]|nr:heat-shock protein HslJ [Gemmatimonadota bacterium]
RGLVVTLGVMACASHAPSRDTAGTNAVRVTLEVDAHRVPCTGEARTRCLRVRVPPDTAWRFFHDPIEGFAFEEGYRWRLDVERRSVANPPADGSAVAYRLVRILSKERWR